MLTLQWNDSPVRTAPLPKTCTQPRGSYRHPRPLDTCAGTARSAIRGGTPVLVASGKPQTWGGVAQRAGSLQLAQWQYSAVRQTWGAGAQPAGTLLGLSSPGPGHTT